MPYETEVVAVVRDQGCADPACAERDQNVVQQRGQFGPPAPFALLDRGDDVGRVEPIVERRVHNAPGPLHGQQELAHEPACAAVPCVNGELIGYDGREERRGQERKERLAETGARLVGASGLQIDIGVEKVFQR